MRVFEFIGSAIVTLLLLLIILIHAILVGIEGQGPYNSD